MFDDNEDNVVLQPRETLHTYTYTDGYGIKSTDYIVYNSVDLTVTVYEREFKCFTYNEWRNYIEQVFNLHQ